MLPPASDSRPITTLCELFYRSVDGFRKPEHLRAKRSGAWQAISSDAFRAAVEETALGLVSLGIGRGDLVAILSENRPEWAYLGRPEATREAIDPDGFFHTGDIGHVDSDGFVVITDRKKDLIATSGGKKIAPQPIENKLKTNPFFAEVVIVGNRRKFPAALVVPNYELLGAWARARGITGSREELVGRSEVQDHYMELVNSMTGELAQFEKIKKLVLLPKELSQEAGELTPTLKVKRRVVEERYKPLIDDMYQGAA